MLYQILPLAENSNNPTLVAGGHDGEDTPLAPFSGQARVATPECRESLVSAVNGKRVKGSSRRPPDCTSGGPTITSYGSNSTTVSSCKDVSQDADLPTEQMSEQMSEQMCEQMCEQPTEQISC
eukprot:CAMPEP_0113853560 /NCGR_PEP_ID=MMETSP0372-20130328/6499_1 /TAXON_ID=340204 /ORGANISM="Lankesteria abbotti" /LENGTH=122 /DNA_ID=CAMNT_0000825965 /DNA_START=289 /DNA_END=657 /DNA_ORIENTATION=+ /assembly_acc=CAM_ASM_000359